MIKPLQTLFLFSIMSSVLISWAQITPNRSDYIMNYLLSREFTYNLGVEMGYQGGLEVFGRTDVERKIRFMNDSLFEEIIIYEDNLYDYHLNDSSGFKPLKREYEISILKGSWDIKDDILFLQFKQENIVDFSSYINNIYYQTYAPEKVKDLKVLRSRKWKETKQLLIKEMNSLCILNGLNRCYLPNY